MPNGKTKVALLLPLSGTNAALGQSMLNAAQQAVFDAAAPNFELIPRDTGGTNEQVQTATRDAIASGAQLLIGPLFATHVPLAQAIAQTNGINLLALSTDTSLATSGVYVMGFAPAAQVDRIIAYAAAHGLRRFAALVPSSPYGTLVGQAFQAAVERTNGTVVAFHTFDPARHDTEASVRDLAERRAAIDALFLPISGADLTAVTNQLAAAGIDPRAMRMLGTGLWDVPDLGKQTPFLTGAWYAASDPAARRGFLDTYAATYGAEPPRIATLAYDATALAAVLAKRGAEFDQASLTNPNGFAGLDGIFRLTPSGLTERGLAVLEVGPTGTQVIQQGPASFAIGTAR